MHSAVDVISNRAHCRERLTSRVRKSPIFNGGANDGALAVRAAHCDDPGGAVGQVGGHQPRFCGQVDSDLAHRLDNLRMNASRWPRPS